MREDSISTHQLDSLLTALANGRRRHVLAATADWQGPAPVDALARSIARGEPEADPAEPSLDSVRAARVSLHHVHLPALAAADLLAYDDAAGTVRRRTLPDPYERLVARAIEIG